MQIVLSMIIKIKGPLTQSIRLTKGFVQLGQDVEAIIGSAHPGFGFGGRNSVGL